MEKLASASLLLLPPALAAWWLFFTTPAAGDVVRGLVADLRKRGRPTHC